MTRVNLTINGRSMIARLGESLLQAAQASNIHIPTLCNLNGLGSVSSRYRDAPGLCRPALPRQNRGWL